MELGTLLIVIGLNFLLTLNLLGILHKQGVSLHEETMLKLENLERKLDH